MEEKYPIKFSLGQFILLLGVAVVMLSLVFLLGARFGNNVFPEHYAKQWQEKNPYPTLVPEKKTGQVFEAPTSNRLMNPVEEEEKAADGPPHFQVASDGTVRPTEGEEEEHAPDAAPQVNKTLIHSNVDTQTMVRFKSSGHSRFAVEVGDYFDELLASKQIRALKGKGYEAYLVIKNPNAASPTYSVRVGIFSDRTVAEEFATQMSNRQGMELRVVQVN